MLTNITAVILMIAIRVVRAVRLRTAILAVRNRAVREAAAPLRDVEAIENKTKRVFEFNSMIYFGVKTASSELSFSRYGAP